jgi:hypothetical protein
MHQGEKRIEPSKAKAIRFIPSLHDPNWPLWYLPWKGFRSGDKNIFNSKEQTIFSDFTLQKWFANLNYFFFLKSNQLTFF